MNEFDVIIIGGGPAGMTAGIYASRAGAKVLMLEKAGVGGQVALTSSIANYPGFKHIDGFELSQSMWEQATELGVTTVFSQVDKLELDGETKKVVAGGVTYSAPAVILSMGACSRGLGVTGEKEFIGRGVSYCAVCDGAFYRGKTVAVVGGGNTALGDVLYLAPLVNKVILVHRREGFRAEQSVIDGVEKMKESQGNIEYKLDSVVDGIEGNGKVEKLNIHNVNTNETETLDVDGVFIAVGRSPNTELLDGIVELDGGNIVANDRMETNVAGVFAAGDVVKKSLRQIATAISDGAIAGTNAALYAKKLKG
ncbi:MAG: thioredoxin-disulfide reductase [Clostridia bacterium]|nr:thioredoxin-disulfide reductase [Clostridia bacterium]